MFRIGVFELALTCGLLILLVIVPTIIVMFARRTDKRLDEIEKKLDKKK
jgi:flagellar biosynthesis protein FliR